MADKKHAKLSPSSADRWVNCPGSVKLSEGRPNNKSSRAATEGTLAHAVLEQMLLQRIFEHDPHFSPALPPHPKEMYQHVARTVDFIWKLYKKHPHSDLLVEDRSEVFFISPDLWGTYDGAIIDYFGTLHIFDFKYGVGKVVQVQKNLQAIIYALGVAHRFDWNFQRVRVWIIQPRVQGFDGPAFWECSIQELRGYVDFFRKVVERVNQPDAELKEGDWCYFCRAKPICPLQRDKKLREGKKVFSAREKTVTGVKDGKEKKN